MTKKYYELQAYTSLRDYVTVCTYYGTRSNAIRKFRLFMGSVSDHPYSFHSFVFRVCAYNSLGSMLNYGPPVSITSFKF